MDDFEMQSDEICKKIFEFLDALPGLEGHGVIVLLALSKATGYHIAALPDNVREAIRERMIEEINSVISSIEDAGMAGTAQIFSNH